MEERIETTHITNTLTYLHLLPKDEQSNELNKVLVHFKKKQRKYKQRHTSKYFIVHIHF